MTFDCALEKYKRKKRVTQCEQQITHVAVQILSHIVRLAHIADGVESKKIVVKVNVKTDRSLSLQQSVNVAFALGTRFPIAGLKPIVCFQDKTRWTGGQSKTSRVRTRSCRMLLCRMDKVQLQHCGRTWQWSIHLSVNCELCANHLLLHLFIVVSIAFVMWIIHW